MLNRRVRGEIEIRSFFSVAVKVRGSARLLRRPLRRRGVPEELRRGGSACRDTRLSQCPPDAQWGSEEMEKDLK